MARGSGEVKFGVLRFVKYTLDNEAVVVNPRIDQMTTRSFTPVNLTTDIVSGTKQRRISNCMNGYPNIADITAGLPVAPSLDRIGDDFR
jgi:hypothetical protein